MKGRLSQNKGSFLGHLLFYSGIFPLPIENSIEKGGNPYMKKWLILLVVSISISVPSPAWSRTLITPPIPKQDTVAIVVTKQPQTEQEIKQLIAPFKDI